MRAKRTTVGGTVLLSTSSLSPSIASPSEMCHASAGTTTQHAAQGGGSAVVGTCRAAALLWSQVITDQVAGVRVPKQRAQRLFLLLIDKRHETVACVCGGVCGSACVCAVNELNVRGSRRARGRAGKA